jgi:hypothetical protein
MGGGYRQRGSSDSRRRRVLFEDGDDNGTSASSRSTFVKTTGEGGSDDASTLRSLRAYGDPAFLKGMPRWINVFPRRKRGIAAWSLCAIALLISILLLGLWSDSETATVASESDAVELAWNELRTICSLQGRGTLSENVSSLLLTVTGVLALNVLSLRRHRRDDYRGAYRIWGWTAVICFMLAASEASGFNQILQYAVIALTDLPLGPAGAGWFAVACLLLGLLFIPRLFLDIWYCRAATLSLAGAVLFFAFSLYFQVAVPTFHLTIGSFSIVEDSARFAEEASELAGCAFLFLTPLLYGRFVLMEAEGRISSPSTSEASAHPIATAWKKMRGRISDKGTVKRKKTRREKISPEPEESQPKKRQSDAPKEAKKEPKKVTPPKKVPTKEQATVVDAAPPSDPSSDQAFEELYREELASRQADGKRMTKAQRKALRRELRKLLEE